ncbi:hypothetical protein DW857_11290 [Phocaeicola vulgatus]|uniref:Uncharacterized protein n=1 Tax=Phocaeicola vulgatus TaxID=821 RepID=A0A395US85_PHOVU|nr:hypothetical protein DWY53_11245 [Phocaeicola vulgatus]RHC21288.1 hypothetical protein DW857_11290 [Phocaeicola vulgatus]
MLAKRIHTEFNKIADAKRTRLQRLPFETLAKETITAKIVEDTMSIVLCILKIHWAFISSEFLNTL